MSKMNYEMTSGKQLASCLVVTNSPGPGMPAAHGLRFVAGWLLLCAMFLPMAVFGQAPNWVAPNAANFSNNMNVTGVVNYEGQYSRSNQDQVAFFVNNEIRGVATMTFIPGFGAEAFFTGTIYSNVATGETVEIRVYYAADDQVYVASNPLDFVHTQVVGSFSTPYEFMIGAPLDEGISLLPIRAQMTLEDVPFEPLNLATSLVSTDNDPVTFSIDSLTPGVVWTLTNEVLSGVPNPGFVGDAMVRVRAVEQTANALSAEQIVTYRVHPEVMGPNWHSIPAQSAMLMDTFPDLELSMMVDTLADSCYVFSYRPEFGQSPNAPAPNWEVNTTFQSTMTITTTVQFTPNYQFDHPDDRLAAFIDGELRGVIGPTDVGGDPVFFLSVGSDAGSADDIRLRFYSGELERYFDYPVVITYVPFGTIGTGANPTMLDMSNLLPVLHPDRRLEIVIQEPDSAAFVSFEFQVADCAFPNQIQDRMTVPFCYGAEIGSRSLITLMEGPTEACSDRKLDLATLVEDIETNGFTYTWTTTGDGDFMDANGDGDNRYEFATTYKPGPQDALNGRVRLTLSLASGQVMDDCSMELGNNEIDLIIKRVGAGVFPWGG